MPPDLCPHGHPAQLLGREAEQEEAEHGTEIHPANGGHNATEQVDVRVRELADGVERCGVPVDVAEPGQQYSDGQEDQVDLHTCRERRYAGQARQH